MQRIFKVLIAFILGFSLLIGGFAVDLIASTRMYGTLINYVGIVRGATQRLVKLELAGEPNDELQDYLNEIILELRTGNGQYGLPYLDDDTYRSCLSKLEAQWSGLEKEIENVRNGGDKNALLRDSETYFDLANDTVFAAENYAKDKTQEAMYMMMIIVAIATSTWLGILIYNTKRMRKLERDNIGLSDIAYRDRLTGAPSLEKFKLEATRLILQHRRSKFAVLYVDFENFKVLNDVFGQAYGDCILQEYVKILSADMGKIDTFCRVSADNFLILRSYTEKEDLSKQQNAVDAEISKFAISTAKEQYFIRTICGICCYEDVGNELKINEIIERANSARKAAKLKSSQNYRFYNESLRDKMLAEKTIENHMQAAMENNEFHVYFQPKVNLKTGEIACAEALSRWIKHDGTMISPAEFIPIFEKNLFIVELDQHVLREVCTWLSHRIGEGLPVVPISVNVSRMQLYDPSFVDTYTKIKEDYGIPDYFLQVEFTESVVFENMGILIQIIGNLKTNGFLCSLDDFGKGYSSLNLLKSLPVDELKLDGLFFDETGDTDRAKTVVGCVVDLAKKLKLQIVAEGVEEKTQVDFLRGIGCNLVQGFIFYRPMPGIEFGRILEQAQKAETLIN